MTINGVTGVRSDITEMLAKLREVSEKSPVFSKPTASAQPSGFDDVMGMVKNAISNVNQAQTATDNMKTAYISGDSNVSMSQLIVASQKSKLAFEGLVTVRNKILEAYKEIMNMPV